jgi:hypothetical protein
MKLFEKCRHCDKRYVGCHSECPDYLKDRATLDKLKASRGTADNEYYNYISESLQRRRG